VELNGGFGKSLKLKREKTNEREVLFLGRDTNEGSKIAASGEKKRKRKKTLTRARDYIES